MNGSALAFDLRKKNACRKARPAARIRDRGEKRSTTALGRGDAAGRSERSGEWIATTVSLRSRGRGVRRGGSRTHSNARSSLTASSTSMIFDPARSCMTNPEVTIGEMPSSMHVPRLEAMITRAQ